VGAARRRVVLGAD